MKDYFLNYKLDAHLDRRAIDEEKRRRLNEWSIFLGILILLSTIVVLVTY